MSLIKCPECKKEFSEYAKSCPNCGFPSDKIIELNRNRKFNLKICKSSFSDTKIIKNLITKIFGYSSVEADFFVTHAGTAEEDDNNVFIYSENIAKDVTMNQLEPIVKLFKKYNIILSIYDIKYNKEYTSINSSNILSFNDSNIILDEVKLPVIGIRQQVDIRRPVIKNKTAEKINESLRKYEQSKPSQPTQNLPTCPICGSTNLTKLSNVGKAAKVGFFGIFGAGDLGKTWKCKNCGSKF